MQRGSLSIIIRVLLAVLLLGASLLAGLTGATSTSAQQAPTATATVEPAPTGELTPEDRSRPDEDDEADGATFDEEDEERGDDDDDDGRDSRGGHHGRGDHGGGKNIVKLFNRQDGRLRVRGNVQLTRIKGSVVEPANVALARATCVGCNTFAVALQIALYRPGANQITPLNVAAALNEQCRGCKTVARAVQFVIPVDDPDWVPAEVVEMIEELDKELKAVHQESHELTVDQAEARIYAVIVRFRHLAESLKDDRDEKTEENSPAAAPTATPTVEGAGTTGAPATPTPTVDPNTQPATPTPTTAVEATATPTSGVTEAAPPATATTTP